MRSDPDEVRRESRPERVEAVATADATPPSVPSADAAAAGDQEVMPPVSSISSHKLAVEIAELLQQYPVRHGQRDDVHEVFIELPGTDDRKTWMSISDPRVERHLRANGYEHFARGPTSTAIESVIDHIKGRGYALPSEPFARRVHHTPDAIWLSLGPDSDVAVRISGAGWSLERNAPILFGHAPNAATWPSPATGGSFDLLRPYLPNVSDEDWPALLGFVLCTFMAEGAMPILVLEGRHGTGKSMATEILRMLVDPVTGLDARAALPEKTEDLYTVAQSSHFLSFDNLSALPADTSDALCRLSTGMARQARKLFSQGVVQTVRARCAIVLNGISAGANREDLLSRSIPLELRKIPQHLQRTEASLRRDFARDLPKILGALFDAVSAAIGTVGKTKVTSDCRLADAAVFATAAEPQLGFSDGAIVSSWLRLQQGAHEEMSTVDPAAAVIERLFRQESYGPVIACTVAELVARAVALERDGGAPLPADFPRSAAKLGIHLKRHESTLLQAGFKIQRVRTARIRHILISRCEPASKPAQVTVTRGAADENGGSA
jgi:putative DNA primase/helicase